MLTKFYFYNSSTYSINKKKQKKNKERDNHNTTNYIILSVKLTLLSSPRPHILSLCKFYI